MFPIIGFGQYTSIPDQVFEQVLINLGYDNIIDGQVLNSNINNVNSLYIESIGSNGISGGVINDYSGIEGFTQLESLEINENPPITSLQSPQIIGNFQLDLTYNLNIKNLKISSYYKSFSTNDILISNLSNLETFDISSPVFGLFDISNYLNLKDFRLNGILTYPTNSQFFIPPLVPLSIDYSNNINLESIELNTISTGLDLSLNTNLQSITLNGSFVGSVLDLSNNSSVNSISMSSRFAYNSTSAIAISYGLQSIILNCQNSLTDLEISYSDISSLSLDNYNLLNQLSLQGNNNLNQLNLNSLNSLNYLSCNRNSNLLSLELNNCPNLNKLMCNNNNIITIIDINSCDNLSEINCNYNPNFESLELNNFPNLNKLICHNNDITTMNINNCDNLSEINCSDNLNLSNVNFYNIPNLNKLECYNNRLIYLDLVNQSNLDYLDCRNSYVICLNLKNGNNLNTSYIDATGNTTLSCIDVDDSLVATALWVPGGDFKFDNYSFSNNCGLPCSGSISDVINTTFDISLYPNPTNENVTISIENFNGNIQTEVYDLIGNKLQTTNKTTISLIDYYKGIYILKVAYGDRVEEIKVIKD